jgi:hypothetical protein
MSSSNGNGTSPSASRDSLPPTASFAGADAIAALRTKPDNVLLFRGFGPLVAALVLFVLMLVLAPSVAPERIVEKPVTNATPTTAVTPATPTTVAN